MIMVQVECQGQGIGSRLLRAAEDELRMTNGRMLIIETSSLAEFEKTRQFYRKHGYAEGGSRPRLLRQRRREGHLHQVALDRPEFGRLQRRK